MASKGGKNPKFEKLQKAATKGARQAAGRRGTLGRGARGGGVGGGESK